MIKFLDLKKVNSLFNKELIKIFSETLDSGWYLMGNNLDKFENDLGRYQKIDYVLGVGSGLDALKLIFKGYITLGMIEEGDEIIVPGNTYIATIMAITENNLKPVFVEPDEFTLNLDISKIEERITKKTKAILVVHLYGKTCWDENMESIAKKYNLLIVEDNAQAIGAEWNKRKTGSLGDAAGFSFYPGKNLGALSDAGAVATKNEDLYKIVKSLRNYGSSRKYYNDYIGYNSRLDEIQAAILSFKLQHLDKENEKRRKTAKYYINNLRNRYIKIPHAYSSFSTKTINEHVWHLFVLRSEKRDNIMKYLKMNDVETMVHYPIPPHKQKAYKEYNNINLPITEKLHNELFSIPISPTLHDDEVKQVISIINSYE